MYPPYFMKSTTTNEKELMATVFCSRNTVTDKTLLEDAEKISVWLAKNKVTLVNGASKSGLMGYTAKCAYEAGGKVYGIGLHKYESEIHQYLTNFEGYDEHSMRQKRLIELGDAYIALAGGLGTIYEILDVHIEQFLGTITVPMIIVGPLVKTYKQIIADVKANGLYHKLPEQIIFAENADEAIVALDAHFQKIRATNEYTPKVYYPGWTSEDIYQHISKTITEPHHILFGGLKMKVLPGVYPSNRFRSSRNLVKLVQKQSAGKVVFDIACGHGSMGLAAAYAGAKYVIQTDINKTAVANAKENAQLLNIKNSSAYAGSLFDPIPEVWEGKADLIVFNPPFHKEDIDGTETDLQYAFRTDSLNVINGFFGNVDRFLAKDGYILLGFSNKDPEALAYLESFFAGYQVETIVHKYADSKADNIIYKLQKK